MKTGYNASEIVSRKEREEAKAQRMLKEEKRERREREKKAGIVSQEDR